MARSIQLRASRRNSLFYQNEPELLIADSEYYNIRMDELSTLSKFFMKMLSYADF